MAVGVRVWRWVAVYFGVQGETAHIATHAFLLRLLVEGLAFCGLRFASFGSDTLLGASAAAFVFAAPLFLYAARASR